jgi:hypothetical protein
MWESRKLLLLVATLTVAGSAVAGWLANIYAERFFPSVASPWIERFLLHFMTVLLVPAIPSGLVWIVCALAKRKCLPVCLIIYAVVWIPIFLSYFYGAFTRP